jgi:WhiB family transcriptional regulator, redox-sensing transcriptional regulator
MLATNPTTQQTDPSTYTHLNISPVANPDKESRNMNVTHTLMPQTQNLAPQLARNLTLNEALLTSVDRELVANGRCVDGAGTMAFLFFSEELHEIAQAKAICANCPVTDRCLSGALIRREPWGVWGGELIMNGKVLAARRRRGRPPKLKVSEMVVDELGCVISA